MNDPLPIGGDVTGRTRPGSPPAQLNKCAVCPKLCRHACPAVRASGDESHVPSVKATTWRRISNGLQAPTPEALRSLFACTDCNAATRYCKHDIEPGQLLAGGRARAQAEGMAPAALEGLVVNLERTGNPFGEQHAERASNRKGVIYFPGCATLEHTPEVVEAACRLLEAAGQLYDLVTDTCSGAPALYAGRPDLAPDWPLPPKTTVISSCPGAVTTLRRRFTGLRSLHLTSYLASRGNLALARSLTETHLFHDPCHLARHQADPTAPRLLLDQVIAEGARLELPDHGHETPCSGGGGLLPLVFPKLARRMANERIDAALETGGPESTLVTACPSCHRQLSHGGRIRVVDLTQLLARAIR